MTRWTRLAGIALACALAPAPAAAQALPHAGAAQRTSPDQAPPHGPAPRAATAPRPAARAELPVPPIPPATPPGATPLTPSTPEEGAPPAAPPAANKGTDTGLPLPRFAALRSDEVNLRSGPGTRYPIQWVYRRRDLPVEIEREFDLWRLVRDHDNVRGWVHHATLTSRRSFLVTGSERAMRRAPNPEAPVVARLKPGVVGRLRSCEAGAAWCQVQVRDYRGWLRRDEFWGTYPGEAVQ